jgi:hypothetical protein
MWKIVRHRHGCDYIKGNNLFSADQIEGIEMGGGEDEEFGDENL